MGGEDGEVPGMFEDGCGCGCGCLGAVEPQEGEGGAGQHFFFSIEKFYARIRGIGRFGDLFVCCFAGNPAVAPPLPTTYLRLVPGRQDFRAESGILLKVEAVVATEQHLTPQPDTIFV